MPLTCLMAAPVHKNGSFEYPGSISAKEFVQIEQLLRLMACALENSLVSVQDEFLKLPSNARLLVVLSSPELALVKV